jgi:hypothetical protein
MKQLVTKLKYETLVVTALAFLTVMTFSALFHAVLGSQPTA